MGTRQYHTCHKKVHSQHVTDSQGIDDSMLCLSRTMALCFYCLLLVVRKPASADKEGVWGTTPSGEKTRPGKFSSYWWTPSLPKLTSLPSLPIHLPLYPAGDKDESAVLNVSNQGPSEPIDQSVSGDGNLSEKSALPTGSTLELLSSMTKLSTESLGIGTSNSPHSRSDNGTLVPTSDTHIRHTQSPTSSSTLEQTGYLPWGTTLALTVHQLPKGDEIFLQEIPMTMSPEISFPTEKTRANPGMSITMATTLQPSEVTSVKAQAPAKGHLSDNTSLEVITTTAASRKVTSPISRAKAAQEADEVADPGGYTPNVSEKLMTPFPGENGTSTGGSGNLQTDDWISNLASSTFKLLPDCNKERSWPCNFSGDLEMMSSEMKPTQNASANQSGSSSAFLSPLMLVPLYTDWNSAMAAWGLAWEAHVYGAGCVFVALTLASALNLLCLPLRCPSGCGYFALVSLFLLAAGGTRSFSLLYDAYGHLDRLPSGEASLMLYEAPFPCLTAAFGLVFLLLSMRSRMQLSYSAFQRPCFLACLVALHFAAAFGPGTMLKFYQQKPPLCLFLSLISRGAFVALAMFLAVAYFVFYFYVRADSKHIYHLNKTSPTTTERYNRCPFAESRDWDRAAVTVCLTALFCLACAGLQLYAILNATGIMGGEEVFHPWCWWTFHFSCRLCELGVCLTLARVVAQPVYWSDQLSSSRTCWTELLTSKARIMPGSCHWSLGQQEKLAIVDTVGIGKTESLPLYTLMDERLCQSLNRLDFLCHSNWTLPYQETDACFDFRGSQKVGHEDRGGELSGRSSFTSDSTPDFRPPSPINLWRSIDEALFGEALFSMSLFSTTRLTPSSNVPVNNHRAPTSLCDPSFYRTSSCADITSKVGSITSGNPPSPSVFSSSCSSPERWRESSSSSSPCRVSEGVSSLVLCPSPEAQARQRYQTLGAASQESLHMDMLSEAEQSVQEEFVSACKQIDTLSISSETIDL
ncbi:proline-rich transmembrane protein 4-like isoform X2 [Stigmatopora argus]